MIAFCQFSRFLRVGTGLFHQHEEDWEEIYFLARGRLAKDIEINHGFTVNLLHLVTFTSTPCEIHILAGKTRCILLFLFLRSEFLILRTYHITFHNA